MLCLACIVIAAMGAIAKVIGPSLPSTQIACLRFAIALPLIVAFKPKGCVGLLRSRHLGLHALRGLAAGSAMAMAFYAYANMRLADATALLFLEPLFIVALTALGTWQRLGARQTVALALGLAGALVILQPGSSVVSHAGLVAVLAAIAASFVALLTRRLAQSETTAPMLVAGTLLPALVLLVPTTLTWVAPSAEQWAWLGLLALAGTLGQALIIAAYRLAPPSAIAPAEYVQLPAALVFGAVFFAEPMTVTTLAGMGLIIAAPVLLRAGWRRDRQLGVRPV
ncbi:MAG: DMT family transporter [Geminicoccaceae bacterium]|nr:MAG: DMT family transporter [Geminicoccaceae bacterium]